MDEDKTYGLDVTISLASGGHVRLIGRELSRDGIVEMLDMVRAAALRE